MILRQKKLLLCFGMLLFVCGLLNGVAVPVFTNPRLALSAHLAACQCGMFLLIVGALWTQMHFAQAWQRSGALLLIIYGMYAIWVSLVAAAVLGTSRSTPIAGAGYAQNALSDALVEFPLLSGSGAALLATAAMLIALYKQKLSDAPAG